MHSLDLREGGGGVRETCAPVNNLFCCAALPCIRVGEGVKG